MRVRLTTCLPLPEYNCWYAIDTKEETSVHALQKSIASDLSLKTKASNISLKMSGFELLSKSRVNGLIRDGDLITIHSSSVEQNPARPLKRKADNKQAAEPNASKRAKKDNAASGALEKAADKPDQVANPRKTKNSTELKPTQTKTKTKNKKSSEQSKKSPEQGKKSSAKNKKTAVINQKSSEQGKKNEKKQAKKSVAKEAVPKQSVSQNKKGEQRASAPSSLPYEGDKKTQKRNKRRTQLKKLKNKPADEEVINDPPETIDNVKPYEDVPECLAIAEAEAEPQDIAPLHLVKNNKNKKKQFLQDMTGMPRTHVRFENDVELPVEEKRGLAIITEAVSGYDTKSARRNREPKYPVDFEGEYCYGSPDDSTQDDTATELDNSSANDEWPRFTLKAMDQDLTPVVQNETPNYADWPDIHSEGPNVLAVDDILAVKIMTMSSTYCPEISDWKQVRVVSVDDIPLVVYEPGFAPEKRYGGKFELRSANDDDEEKEEEEEEPFEITSPEVCAVKKKP